MARQPRWLGDAECAPYSPRYGDRWRALRSLCRRRAAARAARAARWREQDDHRLAAAAQKPVPRESWNGSIKNRKGDRHAGPPYLGAHSGPPGDWMPADLS